MNDPLPPFGPNSDMLSALEGMGGLMAREYDDPTDLRALRARAVLWAAAEIKRLRARSDLLPTEPSARGDEIAERVRAWYERNRESWWARHWTGLGAGPDRSGAHADEFMLRLVAAVQRAAEGFDINDGTWDR